VSWKRAWFLIVVALFVLLSILFYAGAFMHGDPLR
jgi:hypothetical protein